MAWGLWSRLQGEVSEFQVLSNEVWANTYGPRTRQINDAIFVRTFESNTDMNYSYTRYASKSCKEESR